MKLTRNPDFAGYTNGDPNVRWYMTSEQYYIFAKILMRELMQVMRPNVAYGDLDTWNDIMERYGRSLMNAAVADPTDFWDSTQATGQPMDWRLRACFCNWYANLNDQGKNALMYYLSTGNLQGWLPYFWNQGCESRVYPDTDYSSGMYIAPPGTMPDDPGNDPNYDMFKWEYEWENYTLSLLEQNGWKNDPSWGGYKKVGAHPMYVPPSQPGANEEASLGLSSAVPTTCSPYPACLAAGIADMLNAGVQTKALPSVVAVPTAKSFQSVKMVQGSPDSPPPPSADPGASTGQILLATAIGLAGIGFVVATLAIKPGEKA